MAWVKKKKKLIVISILLIFLIAILWHVFFNIKINTVWVKGEWFDILVLHKELHRPVVNHKWESTLYRYSIISDNTVLFGYPCYVIQCDVINDQTNLKYLPTTYGEKFYVRKNDLLLLMTESEPMSIYGKEVRVKKYGLIPIETEDKVIMSLPKLPIKGGLSIYHTDELKNIRINTEDTEYIDLNDKILYIQIIYKYFNKVCIKHKNYTLYWSPSDDWWSQCQYGDTFRATLVRKSK